MVEAILGLVNYGIILVFGIYLSAAFLGIRMNRHNILILFVFSVVVGALNGVCFGLFGFEFAEKIYPVIIHVPLIALFKIYYKYRVISAMFSVSAAYLCCQISNWFGLFILYMTGQDWAYYSIRIIINAITLFLLIFLVSEAMAQILQKRSKDIAIFGLMPFMYYLYDYSVTVYTSLMYTGGKVITEFLGFMLCVFYIVFLFVYFKQYEEKREAEQQNQLMELQRIQSEKEVEMMKRSEYAIAILRHDMRHFLNDISCFIENDEKDRALVYIHDIIENVDKTVGKEYCKNKIINMILNFYEDKLLQLGVDYKYSIQVPKELGFSDSDISAVLSNGMENAIHAISLLDESKRKLLLDIHMANDKLLISIKNTYAVKAMMVDGLPQADKNGHGFGTKSIRYTTEKLKGNCHFSFDDEYFVLRIVL